MRSTRTTTIGLAGLTLLALVAGGCTAGSPATLQTTEPTTAAKPTPTPRVTFNPVLPPGASTPVPVSPDAWLAVGRKGIAGLEVIRAGGSDTMFDSLPAGVPIQPDWGRMIATERDGARTVVDNLVVQPGFGGPSTAVDGAWRLPTIGPDPIPVGVSANGKTVVLVEDGAPASSGTTRFAILDKGVGDPARVIALKGHFDYDALSPDGKTLYVVEHLDADAGGAYQVRAVDVATGRLQDEVVADKRNIDEQMAGYPLAQLRRDDGSVFTLYRGLEHPFIHALNTTEGWALCIDLPPTRADDAAAANDWGLAQSADGGVVYAANATLGLVLEVDPVDYAITRSTNVTPLAGSGDRPGQVRPPGERSDRSPGRRRPRREDGLRGRCRRDPGDRHDRPGGPRHVREGHRGQRAGGDHRRRHALRAARGRPHRQARRADRPAPGHGPRRRLRPARRGGPVVIRGQRRRRAGPTRRGGEGRGRPSARPPSARGGCR